MKKHNMITIISIGMLLLCLIASLFLPDDLGGRITNVITIITAVIGAVALFIQFKKDKNLNKANFLLDYNKSFYDCYKLDDLYFTLNDYMDHPEKGFDFDKYICDVAKYAQWIETMSSLVERELIDLFMMDNVFAYRVFLFTNNPVIQEKELVKYSEFNRGVFYLYDIWYRYEESRGLKMPLSDTALHKHKEYDRIIGEVKAKVKKRGTM